MLNLFIFCVNCRVLYMIGGTLRNKLTHKSTINRTNEVFVKQMLASISNYLFTTYNLNKI